MGGGKYAKNIMYAHINIRVYITCVGYDLQDDQRKEDGHERRRHRESVEGSATAMVTAVGPGRRPRFQTRLHIWLCRRFRSTDV